jgi:agmatinase
MRVVANPELTRLPGAGHRAFLLADPHHIFELTPDTFALLANLQEPRPIGELLPAPDEAQLRALESLLEARVLLPEGEPQRRALARWRPAILRFLSAPRWSAELAGPDAIVILGGRYDYNTLGTFARGSADGPDAVRSASRLLPSQYDLATGAMLGYYDADDDDRRLLAGARLFDAGDVEPTLPGVRWSDYASELVRALRTVRASGARAVLLGGDHSLTLPAIASLDEPALGVIHVDAHADLAPIIADDDLHHGNVFSHVAALPGVKRIVRLGARGIECAPPLAGGVEYRSFSVARLGAMSPHELQQLAPPDLPYYLSIDVDALDPAVAPGTPAPVPDGFALGRLRRILRGVLAGRRLVGIDLMELLPSADRTGITGHAAVQLLIEAIAVAVDQP